MGETLTYSINSYIKIMYSYIYETEVSNSAEYKTGGTGVTNVKLILRQDLTTTLTAIKDHESPDIVIHAMMIRPRHSLTHGTHSFSAYLSSFIWHDLKLCINLAKTHTNLHIKAFNTVSFFIFTVSQHLTHSNLRRKIVFCYANRIRKF